MHSQSLLFFLGLSLLQPTASIPPGAGSPASDWHGALEIAAGRGEKGPWQQNDSRYDYVDDPTPAIDDQGEALVAWVDQGRKDVLLQRYSTDGRPRFSPPVNISRSPDTFSWLPRIVLDPRDRQQVYILWQEIIFSGGSHGGDILFARSRDGGATFSEPVNISRSRGGDGKGRITREVWHNGSQDLAVGRNGALYAAWTEYDGALWFSRSTDGGGSFAPPRAIVPGSPDAPARAPVLAPGNGGTLYLAWTVGEDRTADIHVARSADGGATFGPPRLVAPSKGYSDAPKLAVDGRGTLHLVYAESAGGPFDRYHIRYTRSADGGRSFEAPRNISSPSPAPFTGAAFPALALDGQGNVYVLWELFQGGQARPTAQGMALSRDGGRSFTPPGLLAGSVAPEGGYNGSQQGLLMEKMAVNGAGALAVVNSSLVHGKGSRVWLMRSKPVPAAK